jgi:Do/DeqQ family serine protease
MQERFSLRQRANRAGIAAVAGIGLMAGAARFVTAADGTTLGPATVTTPITHAIDGSRDSYADIVNVVAPAVVTIRTEGKAKASPAQFQGPDEDFLRRFFGDRFGEEGEGTVPQGRQPRTFKQRALGSGVIVTTDGYILTNNHVVDNADSITVELNNGRSYSAKLIGKDKPSDLAVLKIDGKFTAMGLGNSDSVKVGDVVLAVGNPLGIGQTVTMGIISAKGRSTGVGSGNYEDFLQTDAPINHGNSGGALVNTKGELVGINSQIMSNTDGNIGIGFAIPVNMANNVMQQLRTSGTVHRAQLGVTVQQVTSDMAKSLGIEDEGGAIVSSVAAGSAADKAGVKQGDVIVSFDGQPVHDSNTLRNRIAATKPGSDAQLVIVRDGAKKNVSVKLDELNADRVARNGDSDATEDHAALGVSVAPLTPELASRLGVSKDTQGVVVQAVDPNGRAADVGIQAGDVIESVNRQPVKGIDDLRAALKRNTDKPTLLLIDRKDAKLFVTVPPVNG